MRILVGFDGSDNATGALAWAVDEATVRGCPVEALCVLAVPALAYGAPGYLPPTLDRFRSEMMPLVEEALRRCGRSRPAVPVDVRVGEGSAAAVLAERAREPDVDLVVVGARGHSRLTEFMLGSASHALSHTCPKPLVIVPHDWSVKAAGPAAAEAGALGA